MSEGGGLSGGGAGVAEGGACSGGRPIQIRKLQPPGMAGGMGGAGAARDALSKLLAGGAYGRHPRRERMLSVARSHEGLFGVFAPGGILDRCQATPSFPPLPLPPSASTTHPPPPLCLAGHGKATPCGAGRCAASPPLQLACHDMALVAHTLVPSRCCPSTPLPRPCETSQTHTIPDHGHDHARPRLSNAHNPRGLRRVDYP